MVNVGELGLCENITSVVQMDKLKIGVASRNNRADNTLDMIKELSGKLCNFILCTIQSDSKGSEQIDEFASNEGFEITNLKSNWSEKLEVNYLTEMQIDDILNQIKLVKESLGSALASNSSH